MKKGVYCLLLHLSAATTIKVGALGQIDFAPGYYIYVGSALGSGGLSRVSRHIRFYKEQYRAPKWHIDYLMMHAVLEKTFCAETEERLECVLSQAVGGAGVERFGCSDCDCVTHLYYRTQLPEQEIKKAFAGIGLSVTEHRV